MIKGGYKTLDEWAKSRGYADYNTKLNYVDGQTKPGKYDDPANLHGVRDTTHFTSGNAYPADFTSDNHSTLKDKYERSIYDNMCDIIRIYAEYKDKGKGKDKGTKKETFLNSKEYIDALYTSDMSKDTANIHGKFTEKTLEFCKEYKTELELFDLCGDIVKYLRHPYPVPKSLYTDVYNDLKQMKKNFEDLYAKKKKKPINLYEVIHRSF